MGDFGEERERYLTAVNKTAIPLSGDMTGSPLNTIISGVCLKKEKKKRQGSSRCHQIASTFMLPIWGIFIRLSTIIMFI